MTDNQEFLSPQQCFIVYDDLSRKVAISIRNRLSKLGIKCTVWDKKHFEDNEFRMSNFNRVLFLNDSLAKEYLFNAEKTVEISDHVIYKREGRVASLCIEEKDLKFDEMLKSVQEKWDKMKSVAEKASSQISEQDKALIENMSASEFAQSLALLPANNVPLLPNNSEKTDADDNPSRAAEILKKIGLTGSFIVNPVVLTALYFYGRIESSIKNAKDCKQILLLAAAMVFEEKYINDFVRAE